MEAVRPHRFLYDRTQLDFKDVPKKEALWEVIGQQFGITGSKAMRKWRNMRDKYFKVRKQEQLDRKMGLRRHRKRQTWALYPKLGEILERRHWKNNADSDDGGSQVDTNSVGGYDPGWIADRLDQLDLPPDLRVSLQAAFQQEASTGEITIVKQEPLDDLEMTISEHEEPSSPVPEQPLDSEQEDETAADALDHTIAVAKELLHRRRAEFRAASRQLSAMATVVAPTGVGVDASTSVITFKSHAQTQTDASSGNDRPHSSATSGDGDGLDHFCLFVAQRMRRLAAAPQNKLMADILRIVCDASNATLKP